MNQKTVIFIVAVLALFAGYFFKGDKSISELTDLSQRPRFFVQDFKQTSTNDYGVFQFEISGDDLKYFDQQKRAIIKKPSARMHLDNSWQITAQKAERVENLWYFSGVVEARKGERLFKTSALTINPKIHFATTEQPVLVRDGQLLFKGIGARIDTKQDLIEILSDVKTQYE